MMAFRRLRSKCALLAPMCLLVLGAAGNAAADTITLAWDQSSSTVGYRVHVGVQSGSYSQHVDVGSANLYAFTTAVAGQRYCFAVSAYLLSTGVEGPNSSEVCGYSNEAPTLVNPGSRTSTVGQPTSLQLQGFDSQPLTYSHGGLPPGLSMMSSTGYISGTGTTAGTYMVTVLASDGTLSARQTFTWTMTTSSTSGGTTTSPSTGSDSTRPTATIVSPTTASTFLYTGSSLTLSGTASDNVGVTQVRWENSAMRLSGVASGLTNWTTSVPLQVGTNLIYITAIDAAGNVGVDTVTVNVSSTGTTTTSDTTAPTVSIVSPTTASTFLYTGSSLTLSGTASDNVGVTQVRWENSAMRLSGVASGLTNWTTSVPLQVGTNLIYITAIDAAGKVGVDTVTANVSSTGTTTTSDTTAPTVSIGTPTSGTSYSTTYSAINLTGIASDNSGVSRVVWENTATGARGTASGTTSWAISGIALNAGTNYIGISAYDAAGNRGSDSLVVTRSSTTSSTSSCPIASTVSICTPTTGTSFTTTQSSINMTGTAPSVVTRVVWENTANGARGVASGTTNWAISSIPLVAGSNYIEITAYDSAGNPSTDRLLVTRY